MRPGDLSHSSGRAERSLCYGAGSYGSSLKSHGPRLRPQQISPATGATPLKVPGLAHQVALAADDPQLVLVGGGQGGVALNLDDIHRIEVRHEQVHKTHRGSKARTHPSEGRC